MEQIFSFYGINAKADPVVLPPLNHSKHDTLSTSDMTHSMLRQHVKYTEFPFGYTPSLLIMKAALMAILVYIP